MIAIKEIRIIKGRAPFVNQITIPPDNDGAIISFEYLEGQLKKCDAKLFRLLSIPVRNYLRRMHRSPGVRGARDYNS